MFLSSGESFFCSFRRMVHFMILFFRGFQNIISYSGCTIFNCSTMRIDSSALKAVLLSDLFFRISFLNERI
jgi:hypothetical protein